MKIYSLQEENEKLNASRGISQPELNEDMFNVREKDLSSRRQKEAARRTSQQVKQKDPGRSAPKQKTVQRGMSPVSPQQNKPQPRKRGGCIVFGWILVILFFILIDILTEIF